MTFILSYFIVIGQIYAGIDRRPGIGYYVEVGIVGKQKLILTVSTKSESKIGNLSGVMPLSCRISS